MHEAQLHERNSFITLTYNDESLATRRPTWEPTVPYTPPSESTVAQPNDQTRTDETPAHADSLIKRDVQLFVKRLRKDQDARGLAKIRYYLVGSTEIKPNGRITTRQYSVKTSPTIGLNGAPPVTTASTDRQD